MSLFSSVGHKDYSSCNTVYFNGSGSEDSVVDFESVCIFGMYLGLKETYLNTQQFQISSAVFIEECCGVICSIFRVVLCPALKKKKVFWQLQYFWQ